MKIDEQIDTLKGIIDATDEVEQLERMNYRLSDAIREGSTVSEQRVGGWTAGDGDKMCAMSASIVAAKARGYL